MVNYTVANCTSTSQPPHYVTVGVTSVVIILPNICYYSITTHYEVT